MNIAALLTEQARSRGAAAAIIERAGVTTFAQLDERVRRAAAMLRARGVGAGDAVLIFQPMSAALYTALLAVFRLGATAMFLDPSAGRSHIEACCALSPPRGLVALPKAHLLRLTSGALRRIEVKFSTGCWIPGAGRWSDLEKCAPLEEVAPVADDTPALLTFTSGSTGQPKAAVRTHRFLIEQHRVLARSIALEAGEVDLATLPIFTLANLASGVTSLIPDCDLRRPGSIEAAPVLHQIREHRVTRCAASPAFFERLLAADDGTLSAMRKVFTGGAPIFPNLLTALREKMPDARVEAVFGSTEAEPIAHIEEREVSAADRDAMRAGRGLLTGEPVPEISIRILSAEWGAPLAPMSADEFAGRCLPSGEHGEIVVSGGHVLPGYLHGHGDAETKFRVDGRVWHRTGDAGWIDEHGRLWLLGRCAARVSDSRGTLWPFTVECAARLHPLVRRAALLGHKGSRFLFVEIAAPDAVITAEALGLAWAQLDGVRVLPAIPMDARHNAKVDYVALRALLERQ